MANAHIWDGVSGSDPESFGDYDFARRALCGQYERGAPGANHLYGFTKYERRVMPENAMWRRCLGCERIHKAERAEISITETIKL